MPSSAIPDPFTIVEMGPGKGLLARDFLATCQNAPADFGHRLRYILIERSASMRMLQQQSLAPWLGQTGRVTWIDRLEDLPSNSVTGFFFSNELVDAFPVHRIAVIDEKPQEIYVDWREDRFTEVYRPLSNELANLYTRRRAHAAGRRIEQKSTSTRFVG